MKTFLLSIALLAINLCFGSTYYFSNVSGQDSYSSQQAQNPGTPWKSLVKLNAVFNSLNPGDSILFKRGETFYGSITISRSGIANRPIVFSAYGTGAKPVITGLSTITAWTSIGKGLYEATLTNPPTNSLNIVLLNGSQQPIARFPKAGQGENSYLHINSHTNTNTNWTNSNGVITSTELSSVPNFTGGELVQRTMQWIFDRSVVTAQSSNTISYSSFLSPDHPSVSYAAMDGHGFFFQNHINCLTAVGDWCYNKSTKKITVFFGSNNPASYNVQVGTIDNLVKMTSFSYVTFNELEFNGSNENLLALNTVTNTRITSCDLLNAGINGIDIDRMSYLNTNHNEISNCTFKDIINNAANLVESTHWNIANNHFINIGTIQGMGISGDGQNVGIFKAGANSIVEYNELENIGYSGIWYTGSNTIVRYNHIHDFCKIKSDGGGIYTYGATGTNRLLYKNVVHDGIGDLYGMAVNLSNPFSGQVHGIYNDGNTTSVTLVGNSCFNNASSGIFFGSNGEITARENVCFNNKTAQMKGIDNERTYSNMDISDNILFAKEKGSLVMSFNIGSVSLSGLKMDTNYYCRPIWEPDNINGVQGYSHVPFSWDTYHDGGVIEANSYQYYSFDKWKELTSKDRVTRKSPVAVQSPNDIRFEYNATNASKTIALDANYVDVAGKVYNGMISLDPFSSLILIKSGSLTTLPVAITDVKAYEKSAGVQVEWSTASETNVNRYEVEKSTDGKQFVQFGVVPSKGTSTVNQYQMFDKNPSVGNNYYRIKSIDNNGDTKYSQVVVVKISATDNRPTSFIIYPNPLTGNTIHLKNKNVEQGNYAIRLFNSLGQIVNNSMIQHGGGPMDQPVNLHGSIAPGIYQLQVVGPHSNSTHQLLKN